MKLTKNNHLFDFINSQSILESLSLFYYFYINIVVKEFEKRADARKPLISPSCMCVCVLGPPCWYYLPVTTTLDVFRLRLQLK